MDKINYINRSLDGKLADFIKSDSRHKDVLLIDGARQVGKTSLVEYALRNTKRTWLAVNLEKDKLMRNRIDQCLDFAEFTELLGDRLGFNGDSGMVLFLDEAQESRQLGSFVRFMKEDWPLATVILSGSTLSRIFRHDIRYPVGRVRRINVSPFSFSEYLAAVGKPSLSHEILRGELPFSAQRHQYFLDLYDRFLLTGGMPGIVLADKAGDYSEELKLALLADYEDDFIRIFPEQDLVLVKDCLRSVANFVGGPSKNSTVVKSPHTFLNEKIKQLFHRLESWHLMLKSRQLGMGPEGNQHYYPKRYLFDTGILRVLREAAVPSINLLDAVDQAVRQPLGGILENQVAIELNRMGKALNGWKKSSSGVEIDFILKAEGRVLPIECKATLSANRRHLKGLNEYLRIYSLDIGIIVSFSPYQVFDLAPPKQIVNVPGYGIERLLNLAEDGRELEILNNINKIQ